jgi:ATP-binding protein involved in chromosome partitioning
VGFLAALRWPTPGLAIDSSPGAFVVSLTPAAVIEALRPVQDPELRRSIVDLEMVREVNVAGDSVAVLIALTIPGCPLKSEITNRVTEAVKGLGGVSSVKVDFTSMTDDERSALREKLHGDPAAS